MYYYGYIPAVPVFATYSWYGTCWYGMTYCTMIVVVLLLVLLRTRAQVKKPIFYKINKLSNLNKKGVISLLFM
jgi:hypothetical protein